MARPRPRTGHLCTRAIAVVIGAATASCAADVPPPGFEPAPPALHPPLRVARSLRRRGPESGSHPVASLRAPTGIRTRTEACLRRLPLPLGYGGPRPA